MNAADFKTKCKIQAREADVEWHGKHPELWMDACDCPLDVLNQGLGCQNERCQLCSLPVSEMPREEVCGSDLRLPRNMKFGLTSPVTGTTYWWTTCPSCTEELANSDEAHS